MSRYYWCDCCLKKYDSSASYTPLCYKYCKQCNNKLELYNSELGHLLEFSKILTDCKTKESLIRYIVCDGEPADESCVGHPVLVLPWEDLAANNINNAEWKELILKLKIGEKYEFANNIKAYFAKKKPGYDYTQSLDKNDA